VRVLDDTIGVQRVLVRPDAPDPFYCRCGIHKNTVEIEENGLAGEVHA
jgi:hypothetical protein